MESEAFIKIEQESPIESTSNVMNLCMAHFYDDDSIDPICTVKVDPFQQNIYDNHYILDSIEPILDIRQTPLEEIMAMINNLYPSLPERTVEKLRKMVVKRKNFLKRNFAKNRDKTESINKGLYVISDMNTQTIAKEDVLAEIKKKRNRMSAQISRDRKKQKIQQLENHNDLLREETEKIRKQNQLLKQQLESFNNCENKRNQDIVKPKKNKFISILIMLGIIFLFSIIKDSKATSFKSKQKIKKPQTQIISVNDVHHRIVEKSQKQFIEMENNPDERVIKDENSLDYVIEKLNEMKIINADVQVPRGLKNKIQAVQAQML